MSSISLLTVKSPAGALPGQLASVTQVSNQSSTSMVNSAAISASFNKVLAKSTFLIDVEMSVVPNTEVDASVTIQFDGTTVGNAVPWHYTSGLNRATLCFPFFVASSSLAAGSHTLTVVSQVVSNSSNTNQIFFMFARISEFGSLT